MIKRAQTARRCFKIIYNEGVLVRLYSENMLKFGIPRH